jgi:hypothetical protein
MIFGGGSIFFSLSGDSFSDKSLDKSFSDNLSCSKKRSICSLSNFLVIWGGGLRGIF